MKRTEVGLRWPCERGYDAEVTRVDFDVAAAFERGWVGPPPDPELRQALTAVLQAVLREAREAWPSLALPPERFVEHLGAVVDPERDPVEQLPSLAAADLFLARACAEGVEGAAEAFATAFSAELAKAHKVGRARGVDGSDLRQQLLERLLVGRAGAPPRIASYAGQGSLRSWVRVAATRVSFDVQRRLWQVETGLRSGVEAVADGDAELAYLRAHYREAFAVAFGKAVDRLSDRQRSLLRLNVVHGVSGTGIADMFGVHRATAKRWLAGARQTLLDTIRTLLKAELGVDSRELDSIMASVGSRLELSVARYLGDASRH